MLAVTAGELLRVLATVAMSTIEIEVDDEDDIFLGWAEEPCDLRKFAALQDTINRAAEQED
jgi:hypothetical protein